MLLLLFGKDSKDNHNPKSNSIKHETKNNNVKKQKKNEKENNKGCFILKKFTNDILEDNKTQEDFIISIPFLKEKDETSSEDKANILPKIYNCEEIKRVLKQENFPKDLIDKIGEQFISRKDKENVYLFEIKNKRKKHEKTTLEEKLCLGRKKKDDNTERKHNKDFSDNIIKKIKGIFFSNVVDYINEYINCYKMNNEEEFHLLKLDYGRYINNLKKESELNLFEMKLKDLASFQTSGKYRLNENKDINKHKIEKILEQEKDNEIIINLLNMNFGEWIDVFTLKKKMENEIGFHGLQFALEKMLETNNEEYYSRLIFFLFNYKRWFQNKRGRNRKVNMKENGNSNEN